jgi:mono/diheme cytochrome c family protein
MRPFEMMVESLDVKRKASMMYCQRFLVSILLIGTTGFGLLAIAQEKPKDDKDAPVMTAAMAGQETFRSYCASCHGIDGKGHGPAAPALKRRPTDLTQLSKKNGGKFPSATVSSVIRGDDFIVDHGSQSMPIWGDAFRTVNHDETMVKLKIQNLAIYIETIQQK